MPPNGKCNFSHPLKSHSLSNQVRYKYRLSGDSFVPPPAVDVAVVSLIPLKRPYIDLPFLFLEKVVTTIMHGKQKFLRTTVGNLFPDGFLRIKLTRELLAMTGLHEERKPNSLTMDEMEKICFAYKQLCDDNPSIRTFMHRYYIKSAKHLKGRSNFNENFFFRYAKEQHEINLLKASSHVVADSGSGGGRYYEDDKDEEDEDDI